MTDVTKRTLVGEMSLDRRRWQTQRIALAQDLSLLVSALYVIPEGVGQLCAELVGHPPRRALYLLNQAMQITARV